MFEVLPTARHSGDSSNHEDDGQNRKDDDVEHGQCTIHTGAVVTPGSRRRVSISLGPRPARFGPDYFRTALQHRQLIGTPTFPPPVIADAAASTRSSSRSRCAGFIVIMEL